MLPDLLVDRVLEDEALVGSLDEGEGSVLIGAMVERVRAICAGTNDERIASAEVEKVCQRGRKVSAVVSTFSDKGVTEARRAAIAEGWSWPGTAITPLDLLRSLLSQWH